MRVTLMKGPHGPCTYFRMIGPAEVSAGTPDLDLEFLDERSAFETTDEPDLATDVLVVQRPLRRRIADAIPRLQDRGIAVVVDIDDDFVALHPDHRAQQHLDEDHNAEHLLRACAVADIVTAPTHALLGRYAPHRRGALVPNYLPGWALDAPYRRDGRMIAWSGVAADHPGDLEITDGCIAPVLEANGARFHVIGPPEGVAARLGVEQPVWGTGMLPLRDYFDALGSVDVGIVPLAPTEFNAAKSPLKGLEWAAAGVPFVASPTPEYEWLAGQGIGVIARTRQEWEQRLTELLRDEPLRRRVAAAGRRLVRERFLLPANAWRWHRAWAQARENRRDAIGAANHPSWR